LASANGATATATTRRARMKRATRAILSVGWFTGWVSACLLACLCACVLWRWMDGCCFTGTARRVYMGYAPAILRVSMQADVPVVRGEPLVASGAPYFMAWQCSGPINWWVLQSCIFFARQSKVQFSALFFFLSKLKYLIKLQYFLSCTEILRFLEYCGCLQLGHLNISYVLSPCMH
jgi:hypothetical protein